MSLEVQEKVLLALLFDKPLRDAFFINKQKALQKFSLSLDEIEDFLVIQEEGLLFDAQLRIDLILSQLAKQLPLTFSLLSSFEQGLIQLQPLITVDFVLQPLNKRLRYFTLMLEPIILSLPYLSQADADCCCAIFLCEKERVLQADLLRNKVMNTDKSSSISESQIVQGRLYLCEHVSTTLIPLSFIALQQLLKVYDNSDIWQSLRQSPLTSNERLYLLNHYDPRLLCTKALISYQSTIETIIDYKTIELAEGFLPLLAYINGEYTLQYILNELKAVGADSDMLESIKLRFLDLIQQSFIKTVN